MVLRELGEDLLEYGKTLGWYAGRKTSGAANYFETGKGVVVTFLKLRRGSYQKSFLHGTMVILTVLAVLAAPILVSQYPSAAAASVLGTAISPSAVLNTAADISQVDTATQESQKPRRDIEEYTVKGGDTLSSIAKQYSIDTEAIAYLNDFSVNKLLRPGDVIKIPPVTGIIIKVKSGDTIRALAKKYGLPSPQPIVDWPYNTFANDETFALVAGQMLVIPGGKPPASAPVALRQVRSPSLLAPLTGGGQFIWPAGGVITQYFSWYHPGDDIANSYGTPVAAADSGRVVSRQYLNYGYGYQLTIDHGNGYKTLYAHLSRIDVDEGDNVSRGQQIGLMGSTGRSTGSHLHFEIFRDGSRVNPLDYLR